MIVMLGRAWKKCQLIFFLIFEESYFEQCPKQTELNLPGTRPGRLGWDEGELVVWERSKSSYQSQGSLLQIIKISAL